MGPVCCLWEFRRGFRSSTSQDRSPPDVICFTARRKPRLFAKPLPNRYLPWALLGGACPALGSAAPLGLSPPWGPAEHPDAHRPGFGAPQCLPYRTELPAWVLQRCGKGPLPFPQPFSFAVIVSRHPERCPLFIECLRGLTEAQGPGAWTRRCFPDRRWHVLEVSEQTDLFCFSLSVCSLLPTLRDG